MGRAGSVHTGSLWTQMILNLRTNTMAVLIITATLGAKNTVTLSTQKFLFGAFVPFWDIFRYVCLDKIIHIFQTPNVFVPLDEKHCVFFPIPIPQYENKTPCLRAWPATLMMKVKTILISGWRSATWLSLLFEQQQTHYTTLVLTTHTTTTNIVYIHE